MVMHSARPLPFNAMLQFCSSAVWSQVICIVKVEKVEEIRQRLRSVLCAASHLQEKDYRSLLEQGEISGILIVSKDSPT